MATPMLLLHFVPSYVAHFSGTVFLLWAFFAGSVPVNWDFLAGPDFKLQCLLLQGNVNELISAETKAVFEANSRKRMPPLGLAINDAGDPLCV